MDQKPESTLVELFHSGSLMRMQAICWPQLQASWDLTEVKYTSKLAHMGLSIVPWNMAANFPHSVNNPGERERDKKRDRQREPKMEIPLFLKPNLKSPGKISQLVRASSRYTKVMGSISSQGTYKKRPMNAFLSLSLSLSQINK